MPVLLVPNRRTVVRTLFGVLVVLTLLHVGGRALFHLSDSRITRFDFGGEATTAAWFAASVLLVAGALAGVVGWHARRTGEGQASRWLVMSAILVYISVDEAAVLHEAMGEHFADLLGGDPSLVWVGVFTIPLVAGSVFFLPFLRDLDAGSRWRLIRAAAILVGGAMGVEALGGVLDQQYGDQGVAHSVRTTIEELMEFTGAILLVDALLYHLGTLTDGPRLAFAAPVDAAATNGDGPGPQPRGTKRERSASQPRTRRTVRQ